ncbi:MAG: uracil-DNA glycosylase [Candidatus Dojkabacteria bacterium]
MNIQIEESWKEILADEFKKEYFIELVSFVKNEYKTHEIFPHGSYIFRAFNLCPVHKTKVIILGQDPYHTPGVANGLAFSASPGQKIPPSLRNIYKELNNDLGKPIPKSPDLTRWAKQGVLLLNATLTVRAHSAGSHQNRGWEKFTDSVIHKIADYRNNLVFILWGAYAKKKASFIDRSKHLVIESAHPSPFSAAHGFFGSKPFSRTNEYLISKGLEAIEW